MIEQLRLSRIKITYLDKELFATAQPIFRICEVFWPIGLRHVHLTVTAPVADEGFRRGEVLPSRT
ncbi:hypothetical protein C491_10694 [Natronococcus amylolyticus DSM 10524]|uniref:Uncharacterized protein n=1 Tax=Natronococcus amylolyticus DSM 10524 TaxID=1227497 RepID=L9X6L4_9EURY|nr:hypothetical protein C491_10694 [Natronococcus amylolyticus DSM 10524]